MSRVILEFSAGDAVPEWLLACDPASYGARPGETTFGADGCLVETDDGIWVLPCLIGGAAIIQVNGAQGDHRMSVAGRTVILPMQTMTMAGPDDAQPASGVER